VRSEEAPIGCRRRLTGGVRAAGMRSVVNKAGGATYREIDAKSITRIPGTADPWFLARYGMNLYRGCEHGCLYCDGRAERYYVEGDFARDVMVKRNAVQLLGKELVRRREPGFVMLGGGVCDAYQPADEGYRLARGALEVAEEQALPVHVLTKSTLVERDLDVLERIAAKGRAILSFSINTVDDELRQRFEPGAAPVEQRWELLERGKSLGLATGVMAMPVLPGLSDQPEHVDALYARAAQAGADFVLAGGMTLRPGRQKALYLDGIRRGHPDLVDGYLRLYRQEKPSGAPDERYLARLERRFAEAARRHGLPGRPPRSIFRGLIPRYTEAAVLLEHREAELRWQGEPGRGLARAGHALQKWGRSRFAAHRKRSYDWRSVERELDDLLQARSLPQLPGMTAHAAELVHAFLTTTGTGASS